jgi:hypothetical protein
MGILSGNPVKEPMHYGEVFQVFTYLQAAQSSKAYYQVLLNHAGDQDLKNLIEDILESKITTEINQTQEILKANGIALPPAPPERPHADLESIPVGARINDPEIAMIIQAGLAANLVVCSQAMGVSIREDIGLMFGQFHATTLIHAGKILRLSKEKGWLVPPPLHQRIPEYV